MPIVLPPLVSGKGDAFKAAANYSAAVRRPIEPVGRYFLAHASRTLRGHTWSEYELLEAEKNVTQIEVDEDEDLGNEVQSEELLEHDPREWKTADLYAVLGLSHLRYKATEDQIRRAHRKQILQHHPDKKSASGGLEQDDFFKIIQKAFEVMLDTTKRQQYDSIDTKADIKPPAVNSKVDFIEAWTPVFVSEARFSKKQPVPALGTSESTKEEVEAFYNFWGKFDSWKTFEFKDEDVPDDTANRDHKRYIERKNVAARKKLKQDDNKRVIDLVERAHREDPRIKAFKDAVKQEKERKKWEREAGTRKIAEEKAAAEAAAAAAAAAALEAAANKGDNKKAKEAAKAAKKKMKRAIRGAGKEFDYFGDSASASAIDIDLEKLVDALNDVQLTSVTDKIKSSDAAVAKAAIVEAAKDAKVAVKYFV